MVVPARRYIRDENRITPAEQLAQFYMDHPVKAAEDLCGVKLVWLQRIALKALWSKTKVVFKWSRGASKCQHGSDLQYLADTGEYKKIEDLCGKKIKVLAMDENYKLVKADGIVESNGIAECFKIRLRSGRSISVTKEHPFYTINGWVDAKNLKVGTRVGTARKMPHVTQNNVGRSKARTLGYLIGDGSLTKNILFTQKKEYIMDDFKSCIKDAFPNVNLKNAQYTSSVSAVRASAKDKKIGNTLKKWLEDIGIYGKGSHDKFVPECVYTWSLDDISNFIGAYFDCDGTVRSDNNSISITSVSEELLKGVQRLFLKFGIISSIKKANTTWVYNGIRKRSIAYNLYIYGNENVIKFIENIYSVSGKLDKIDINKVISNPNLDTIPKEIWQKYIDQGIQLKSRSHARCYAKEYSPSRDKLNKFGHDFGLDSAVALSESDIYWDEVESVESIGEHETYAMEVPKYHNYVADTIITHNSFLVAVYLWLVCIFFPGIQCGVFAPGFRQAVTVYNYMFKMYENSPYLRACVKGRPTQNAEKFIIKLKNGSVVKGLPLGDDGGKARSERFNVVVIDEYAQIKPQIVEEVLRPMLSVAGKIRPNQMVRMSSAYYSHYPFHKLCQDYKRNQREDPENYHFSSFNFLDVLLANSPDFKPDIGSVIDAYKESPESSFMMEWIGITPDEMDSFFSSALIANCTPQEMHKLVPIEYTGDPNASYILAVDPARSAQGDLFALVLLKLKNHGYRQITKCWSGRGLEFPEMVDRIRTEIHVNEFNVVDFRLDLRGGGQAIQDLLKRPWVHGGKVYPPIVTKEDGAVYKDVGEKTLEILNMVNFSPQNNNKMYFQMKSDLENGFISFPIRIPRGAEDPINSKISAEIESLKSEMITLEAKQVSYGLKFQASSGNTDDRISAAVMANEAAAERFHQDDEKIDELFDSMLNAGGWS